MFAFLTVGVLVGVCPATTEAAQQIWLVRGGSTVFVPNEDALNQADLEVYTSDAQRITRVTGSVTFDLTAFSTFSVSATPQGVLTHVNGGVMAHDLMLLLSAAHAEVPFKDFPLEPGPVGTESLLISRPIGQPNARLDLRDAKMGFDRPGRLLLIEAGEVVITAGLATALGQPGLSGVSIGEITIQATLEPVGEELVGEQGGVAGMGNNGTDCNQPGGPDVIVGDLIGISNYTTVGGIDAFAVGTTSCNVGDATLSWVSGTNQHPVIGQAIYRLKNNRFEQVGISWLKHGFTALTENICGCHGAAAQCPGPGGSVLGVGCSDPYSSGLNGSQGGLGPRFEVNPFTGFFLYPFTAQGQTGNSIYKRVQVATADLDTTSTFFCEGHYVAPDDASSGNQANNASYRRITLTQPGGEWSASNAAGSTTQREQPAIRAWKDTDATVTETDVTIPSDGLVIVSSKATSLGGGLFHYEYAVQNLYSDRAIGSFTVPIPAGTSISNPGFHDVSYHSGEPYDGTDWPATIAATTVSWQTTPYATNPNANALRWGTLYNFRFDANVGSANGNVTLGLFKPGSPTSVTAEAVIPTGAPPVCGNGSVDPGEECDPPDGLHCNATCQWICGDGVTQSGEQCDDGNTINNDGCTNNCTLPACGDGILHAGEQCDDGNTSNLDACTNACNNAVCGDGFAQPTNNEQCDDGNTVSGDGCSATCQSESNDLCASAAAVGNGSFNFNSNGANTDGPAVTCENNATLSHDVWYNYTATCSGTANFRTCNTATFDTAIAVYNGCACPATSGSQLACDDDSSGCGTTTNLTMSVTQGTCYKVRVGGYSSTDQGTGTLTISCTGTTCGNGMVEAGEFCDPPNGTTCSSTCQRIPTCGDGFVDAGEGCDDGNTANGDGCSSTCQVENGPANNQCANRISIVEGSHAFSTLNATTDGPNEPGACNKFGFTNVGNDIWYCYTAACNGTATVDLCNSSYDTKVAIYNGCTCPTIASAIACDDDACGTSGTRSQVQFPVAIGGTYLVRVGGFQTATGTGTMAVSCAAMGCQNAAACDDGNACTNDACNAGTCAYTNNSNSCDDADDCTTNDACSAGSCVGGPPPNCPPGSAGCTDCNGNNVQDACEGLPDCDGNGIPDQCEFMDCNNNGVADVCDIANATEADCDGGPVGVKTAGQTRYISLCIFCHGANGVGGVGPALQNHSRTEIWDMLLPPTNHPGGAHPEYTQQDYADLEAFLAQAGSRGRPDRIPDSCQSLLNCDAADASDGCELDTGTQVDADYDGIPDDCLCLTAADCDDGVFCNGAESCVAGQCQGGSDPCPSQYCSEGAGACVDCLMEVHCADALYCNGDETCVGGSCVAGTNPCGQLNCNEATDTCDACVTNAECDDSLYCNGDESCVSGSCVSGAGPCQGLCNEILDQCVDCLTDVDCDDAVFCNGAETCAGTSCQAGSNPCPVGTCYEPAGRCIPDSCAAPTVLGEASRYIAVTPAPSIGPVAILVVGDPQDADVACVSMYVQANGTLGANPVFRTPAEWGTVHVRGQGVIPEATYVVAIDCGAVGLSVMSPSVAGTTWVWADPARNNLVNLDDMLCTLTAFSGSFNVMPSYCSLPMVDLMGCTPNGTVDIDDILAVLNAFGGADYPCAAPCP